MPARRQPLLLGLMVQMFLLCAAMLLVAGCGGKESPVTQEGTPVTLPSGLVYVDLKVGSGDPIRPGQIAVVHYTGWLDDGGKPGRQFDSSYSRNRPFDFRLGARQVIQGWDEGVAGMRVGGKRRLTIPPQLGYGERGADNVIPPNATLIFDVELLEIR